MKNKKVKNKNKDEEIVIIDITFEKLAECTSYFYTEYGKLNAIRKKTQDVKKMHKGTKKFLDKQLKNALNNVRKKIPNFENIETCTEFFYNEFGKLNSARLNINDKKLVKFISDFFTEEFKKARKIIKKKNKDANLDDFTNNQTNQLEQGQASQNNKLEQAAKVGLVEDVKREK